VTGKWVNDLNEPLNRFWMVTRAKNSMERAVEAVARVEKGSENELVQCAVAFGKAQAYYSLGILDEEEFDYYRRTFLPRLGG
jgi:hypothetical protein